MLPLDAFFLSISSFALGGLFTFFVIYVNCNKGK